jgi:hypothetical protein
MPPNKELSPRPKKINIHEEKSQERFVDKSVFIAREQFRPFLQGYQ